MNANHGGIPEDANGSSSRLPLIGVTSRSGELIWVQKNTRNYMDLLTTLQAQVVVLSPDRPARLPDGSRYEPDRRGRLPEEVLDHLDGLVLAGGGDVHPRYFGQELAGADPERIDPARDELELTLARQALDRDLPLFGICRGCQVLNVAAGGGMVQHFDGHRSSVKDPELHAVAVTPGGWLHSILEQDELEVNTYHHQGVDLATLAPSFQVDATALPDDWLVEAFHSPEHRWVLGVQWHPERLFELPQAHMRIWESFLAACQETQARRQP